nr:hypothetical protein BaRGS_024976 [Batillaria attramentaria]
MYAALHSVPHAFLINLRDGDVERVPAVRRKELSNLTNTEFGAVAFTLDGQILGTFHRILSGVEPASGTDEPDDHSESEESDADSDYEIPDVVEGMSIL